eukprot:1721590-Lingulodinium_polyedra.AAC.1
MRSHRLHLGRGVCDGPVYRGRGLGEGYAVDVATREKKRFSGEDLQGALKRLRADAGKDESSDLGLSRD